MVALLANFFLIISFCINFFNVFAILKGFSGSKYNPPFFRTSGIGPRLEQAIGKPDAIASISEFGIFSQLDANINKSDFFRIRGNFFCSIKPIFLTKK